MLDPRERELLLTALRPPAGYSLDVAVGTTYSLDLIALLTTPLAFAMFDWQDGGGRLVGDPASGRGDPLALLESLRRTVDKVHLFCQAGRIKIPPAHQRLLVYLERSVIEVVPPAARESPESVAVFHPKVWVLRFAAADQPARFRLICSSRNLTFDSSWDTVLVLDGELADRERAFAVNRPLSEFVARLPAMAVRAEGITERARADVARIASEVLRVNWEMPEGVDEIKFCPLGIDALARRSWPFDERMDRLLVIAPFVNEAFLRRVTEQAGEGTEKILVSRMDALSALSPASLKNSWTAYHLDEGAEGVPAVEGSESPDTSLGRLRGLHAKTYVAHAGRHARVWTGSANATSAAYSGNVEFLVELLGTRKWMGVEAILGTDAEPSAFRRMLLPFDPAVQACKPDPAAERAEHLAEQLASRLAALAWSVHVEANDGAYVTAIRCDKPLDLPEGASLRCRPISLPATSALALSDAEVRARFGPHAEESITPFVALDIAVRVDGAEHQMGFVVCATLTGGPADRRERALRYFLRDSKTLLRFLLMLLSADPDQLFDQIRRLAEPAGTGEDVSDEALPVMEHMLRALDQDPEKLGQVITLVADLRRTTEGQAILPAGFDAVWEPIARVHAARRPARGVGA